MPRRVRKLSSYGWSPPQELGIGEKLLWKYEEIRHAIKPFGSESFENLRQLLAYICVKDGLYNFCLTLTAKKKVHEINTQSKSSDGS